MKKKTSKNLKSRSSKLVKRSNKLKISRKTRPLKIETGTKSEEILASSINSKVPENFNWNLSPAMRVMAYFLAVTMSTAGIGYYLAFAATTTIGDGITTTGYLSVGTTSFLTGAVNASSTLQVTGDATFYGNIGVGTTSPAKTLSVQGNGLFSGDISVANFIATGTTRLNGIAYTWPAADGNSGETLSTDGAGNLSWAAGGGGGSLFTDGGLTTRLTSTDNLGVGTTSTAFKFGVQGNGLFSGSLTAANITATGTMTLAGNLLPSTSPASTSASISTTLINSSTVIQYSALAIGGDGNPVIAYYDSTNRDLVVTKCGNVSCSLISATTTVDSLGDVGSYASIATTTDGFPVISYYDATNENLKVAKCGNASCSSGNTITTVDTEGTTGQYSSIAVPADNLPVISYYYATGGGDLKVVKCGNASCSSGNTITTADTTSSGTTALAISTTDGFPVIGHFNGSGNVLRVTKCTNASCSANSTTEFADTLTGTIDIQIGSDGFPVFAFQSSFTGNSAIFKCSNAACTAGALTDLAAFVGPNSSIVIGADGFPVVVGDSGESAKCDDLSCSTFSLNSFSGAVAVTYTSALLANDGFVNIAYSDSANSLKFMDCTNNTCAAGNTSTLHLNIGKNYLNPSIGKGSDDLPIISYHDDTNGDLNVTHCDDASCSTSVTTILDSADDVGDWSAIAIGGDNLPVIAYQDATNNALKVAHCSVDDCSSSAIEIIETGLAAAPQYMSIAISGDGFPVISYHVSGVGLKTVKCGNAACSAGNTITIADGGASFGVNSSIAIGSDGFPVIAHFNNAASPVLRLVKCGNASCSQISSAASLTNNVNDSYRTLALAIGQNGLPAIVFSYQDYNVGSPNELDFIECSNSSCTGNTNSFTSIYAFQPYDDQMAGLSMKMGADGFPVIVFVNSPNSVLQNAPTVIKCGSFNCASGNKVSTLDNATGGGTTSISLGADGYPIIAYLSSGSGLQYVKCGDSACQSFGGANFSGGSDIGTTALFFHNAYIESIFANSIKIKRFDLAEDYYSQDALQAGDIVALDSVNPLHIHRARLGDGARVIGVVSTEPALTLSDYLTAPANGDKNYPVALAGRVPVRVSLEGGNIRIGDAISISGSEGVGRKAGENNTETVIGYALEELSGDANLTGTIKVFVSKSNQNIQPMVLDASSSSQSLLDLVVGTIRNWLSGLQIVIEDGILTVKNLVADRMTAKKLCLEDVCIDKAQLQAILNASGNPQPAEEVSAPAEAPTENSAEDPVIESSTEESPVEESPAVEIPTTEPITEISETDTPIENPPADTTENTDAVQ